MKDEKLEKQFEEYFKGASLPSGITDDAKKHVKAKRPALPRFVKFASVAASFIIVFVTSVVLTLKFTSSPDAPDAPPAAIISTYGDEALNFRPENAKYITKLDKSLKPIEHFARADNAIINDCYSAYSDEKLTFVAADVSSVEELTRYEAKIYVEFTDLNTVYSPLEEYFSGTQGVYRNAEYRLIRTVSENGEPVNKLYVSFGNAKYYVNVTSSDEDAYKKYLELIVK